MCGVWSHSLYRCQQLGIEVQRQGNANKSTIPRPAKENNLRYSGFEARALPTELPYTGSAHAQFAEGLHFSAFHCNSDHIITYRTQYWLTKLYLIHSDKSCLISSEDISFVYTDPVNLIVVLNNINRYELFETFSHF